MDAIPRPPPVEDGRTCAGWRSAGLLPEGRVLLGEGGCGTANAGRLPSPPRKPDAVGRRMAWRGRGPGRAARGFLCPDDIPHPNVVYHAHGTSVSLWTISSLVASREWPLGKRGCSTVGSPARARRAPSCPLGARCPVACPAAIRQRNRTADAFLAFPWHRLLLVGEGQGGGTIGS